MESLQPSFATIAYRNQDWISWIRGRFFDPLSELDQRTVP